MSPTLDELIPLPPVLAGPLLRRLEPKRLVLWLVGTRQLSLTLRVQGVGDIPLDAEKCTVIPVGTRAFVHLIDVSLENALPLDEFVDYDVLIDGDACIADWAPHLLYGDARCPNFVVRSRNVSLLSSAGNKSARW